MALRVLVAYAADSTHVQTTLDYLNSLKSYLVADVEYVNVLHNAQIDFDLNDYDVVFHNSCARLTTPGYVSDHYLQRLRSFRGLKILAVQDEYDNTNKLKRNILKCGFQVILTCVPQDSLEYVYPVAEFSQCRFETVLTGHVPDDFAERYGPTLPLRDRKIVIGYRGRDIGGFYGRLAFDKYDIGRQFQAICRERGIVSDIAMDEASRIYGMAWFDFVGACRTMLGTESGSNVFDFDGSLVRLYRKMEVERGRSVTYEEFLPIVAQKESEISMGQISPRIFECALMRTAMVLYRGSYSGAIVPDEHYIALEKDYSNLDEVLRKIDDLPFLEAMTARAYDHLVGSGKFSYRAFIGRLQGIIEEELPRARAAGAGRKGSSAAGAAEVAMTAGRLERPTEAPLSSAVYEYRNNIALLRIYSDECEVVSDRIYGLFPLYKNERDRLLNVYGIGVEHSGGRYLYSMNCFDQIFDNFNYIKMEIDRVNSMIGRSIEIFSSTAYRDGARQTVSDAIRCSTEFIDILSNFSIKFSSIYNMMKDDFERFAGVLSRQEEVQEAALADADGQEGVRAELVDAGGAGGRFQGAAARLASLRAERGQDDAVTDPYAFTLNRLPAWARSLCSGAASDSLSDGEALLGVLRVHVEAVAALNAILGEMEVVGDAAGGMHEAASWVAGPIKRFLTGAFSRGRAMCAACGRCASVPCGA